MGFQKIRSASLHLFLALALLLGLGFYFSKALKTLHPPFYLFVGLGLGGFLVSGILGAFTRPGPFSSLSMLVFQLIQGGVGFALGRYYFNLPLEDSLCFPAGAALGFLLWISLKTSASYSFSALVFALFIASGFAISLRLGEVPGSILYSLALANSFFVGFKGFEIDSRERELWGRALFYTAILAASRAVLQYYLLESNYASLGVVITHPYTFVALFIGIFSPLFFYFAEKEGGLPQWLLLIMMGIVLPFGIGFFAHVRPLAGFLMGILAASFMVGILLTRKSWIGWGTLLSLAISVVGLPYFQQWLNLERNLRLQVLAGMFGGALILYLFTRLFARSEKESSMPLR